MILLDPLLKTQQLAEALGVSVSTVKRWVDSGAIRASRTVGKHRLVSLAEAMRFAREQNLSLAGLESFAGLPARSMTTVDDQTRESVTNALRRGRAAELKVLLASAHATLGTAWRLGDDLIRPCMEQLGGEWYEGSLDVYQEHRASRLVESALMDMIARLTPSSPTKGAPLAIGASPEGDLYTLAGLLCELTLREMGWDVVNLGPNLPLASLANAVRVHQPRLLWLTVNHLSDPERFVQEYKSFYEATTSSGVSVCLGGSALDVSLRTRLVAASFGERLAHLAEFARGIVPPDRPQSPGIDLNDLP